MAQINTLQKISTSQPTARAETLRNGYHSFKDKAVIDILRIKTRIMQETEGQPAEIRQAKAFAATVRETPINIYPDELFVGWLYSVPRGSTLNWQVAVLMQEELDELSTRKYSPFLLSDEDKQELKEKILPYWNKQGRIPYLDTLSHWMAGYEKVLKKGILGIKKDAEEKLASLDLSDPDDLKKQPFLSGVITAMEAAAEIGPRFAEHIRKCAAEESEDERKAELLKIAGICDRVPANPAQTFHEALQSVWFVHMMHAWDQENAYGTGPGRVDQFLYPFYKKDLEEGRITRPEAQELLDTWIMRFSQYYPIMPTRMARWWSPFSPGHHIDLGGLKSDGSDGSNDLSYMFLEAMAHVPGLTEPTLGLLVHSKTPEELLIKACQLISLGGGWPMFINHDLMVQNLLSRSKLVDGVPMSLEIARSGACIGCHEPVVPNMESGFGWTALNLATILEHTMNNGKRPYDQKQLGPETGDPRKFKSFEEFRDAYEKQVSAQLKHAVIQTHRAESAVQPKLFCSALVEDCIEKGLSFQHGGARYNIGAVQTWGRIDVANSLTAIKKLVYEDQKITMEQLCEALTKNFEGHEDIRKLCLEAPKFGNDDDFADEQVAWVTHLVKEEASKYRNVYGGRKGVAEVPSQSFISNGKRVGALPSGRLAGDALCEAITPTMGSDLKGPTAVLKSVGKINNAEYCQGQTLNIRIDPSLFDTDDGFKRLADLVRVFVDERVDHVQFNVVSSKTLRAAQAKPEDYRDLTVKVAGYNAPFTILDKETQDSLIARTEHAL